MNPVVHFEMPYEKVDRVVTFYRTVFGWEAQLLAENMGNYIVVTTTFEDVKYKIETNKLGGNNE